MKAKRMVALACLMGLFCLAGCVPLLVGGAAVGAGSGTYIYVNGELRVEYNVSFEQLRTACEMTIAEMGGKEVVPDWKIGEGTINANIKNEKVRFHIEYKDKEATLLGIRVGYFGDKQASILIKDKVSEYLIKNQ
ncbi:MAG: DUF3568 family protein [Syntrophaceae bacterium]|nr:DUF3568 family protein [Syntrophaceae bacterium]